ncbi:MAG: hypothetical protein F4X11_14015 [Acidobacteria bacterium]|nr:hypothetical protein [Acidobacteriota bacterium]
MHDEKQVTLVDGRCIIDKDKQVNAGPYCADCGRFVAQHLGYLVTADEALMMDGIVDLHFAPDQPPAPDNGDYSK